MAKSPPQEQEAILRTLLRELREESELRQQELADRLGVPQSFVSKYESGERRLDILELRDIARALGIPFLDLIRRLERVLGGEGRHAP